MKAVGFPLVNFFLHRNMPAFIHTVKLKTWLGCIDSQHLYFAFLIRFAMVCLTPVLMSK
uniref:Uncharacterized protein n=1 Tax=Candidatus Kentrum eta TaxID=2126337 RepID=A0A450VB79_9GAMM|nr:MAG: hypothetical protein BECKH772A_GA0070896_102504 [Candidatus Kentron sp. H]VFK02105.1 MAG: hypothetical protein BECKH772B_GA0070898_102603 [Candidatus Kentron sp. H]VFK05322.1 MAG: hypothetical protein BECKH772C_GA0070978_102593 [Candidatus Kentron sp. H]